MYPSRGSAIGGTNLVPSVLIPKNLGLAPEA